MVLNSIEKLLEKYDNCETTIKEEERLKAYFSQENVAPHLEAYKPLFVYFAKTQKEEFTKEVPLVQTKRSFGLYRWLSVAAVLVLMVAVFAKMVTQPVTLDDLNEEELAAYTNTIEAFNLLGANFNKGTENINALYLMSDSFNKGTENMEYLGMFAETKDKIFIND